MKNTFLILILVFALLLPGCSAQQPPSQVVATIKPVYDFTSILCQNTDITIELLVTESLSCLHDYTLQVRQMRAIEGAKAVILSGAGLEDFLSDALSGAGTVIDASTGITFLCNEHEHDREHDEHHHEQDPHIWLSVSNARIMAENICNGLAAEFPQHSDTLQYNLKELNRSFDELVAYGSSALSSLSCKDLITFHDGFGYFADFWGLSILHSLEEESGSEASASELKELIGLVESNNIPAIFTEASGSLSAAQIVAAETGICVYSLNMGMSDLDYFETLYHNIDIIREAFE